jgi:methyl-accepting chemotaxis protein
MKMKLVLSFSVIVIVNICFGMYSIRSLFIINDRVVEADSWTVGVYQVGDMQLYAATVRIYDLDYILQTEEEQKRSTLQKRMEVQKKADDLMGVYKHEVETIPYDTEKQRQEDLAAINEIIARWKRFLAVSEKLLSLADSGLAGDAANLVNGESLSLYKDLEAALTDLYIFNKEGAQEVTRMSEEIFQSRKRAIITVLAVVAVFSTIVTIFLTRGLRRSIDELLRVSESVGEGNLAVSATVFANDEFGKLSLRYNHTIENIKSLVSSIQESASYMSKTSEDFRENAFRSSTGTEKIVRSIEQVSLQSDKQHSEIESVTITINEMAGGIANAAEQLDTLADRAVESVDIARKGGEFMQKAVAQMGVMESAVNTSSEVVTALGERSNEIGRIIGTITNISSQTNLLALNAAIEAARAGDHGRGFSVVAEEVKELAEESRKAAEEISHLISSIQGETSRAVEVMEGAKEEARMGSLAMADGGRSFDDLSRMSVESSENLQNTAASMREMSTETSGIVAAVRKIEEAGRKIVQDSQSIVATAEEQAASMSGVLNGSQNLAEMASDMLDLTRRFSV